MKKYLFLLVVAAVSFCGCEMFSSENAYPVDFAYTGCASDTKAGNDETPQLTLEYTVSGLAIICNDVRMNCMLKTAGIQNKLSVDGNTIDYVIFIDSEVQANCICLVHEITSMVSGLKDGQEYTLNLNIEGMPFKPIDFTYQPGLRKTVDLDLYKPDPIAG